MLGVAIGDLHGSVWERGRAPSRSLQPLGSRHRLTDDTVMSMAVAQHLLEGIPAEAALKRWASQYPDAGYGGNFMRWALLGHSVPPSWANGALMRIAPAAILSDSLERAVETSLAFNRTTHDHPIALEATRKYVTMLWLALEGASHSEILRHWTSSGGPIHDVEVHREAQVDMRLRADETLEDVMSCLAASTDFDSLIATCLFHGGDTDTIAAIAGALGELLWGISEVRIGDLSAYVDGRIDRQMRKLYDAAATLHPSDWGPGGARRRW